jgi:hypothetical protein
MMRAKSARENHSVLSGEQNDNKAQNIDLPYCQGELFELFSLPYFFSATTHQNKNKKIYKISKTRIYILERENKKHLKYEIWANKIP